jgi:hypothetical protein
MNDSSSLQQQINNVIASSGLLGKSTLFKTGMISKSFSKAKVRLFELVYFVLHLQSKCLHKRQ